MTLEFFLDIMKGLRSWSWGSFLRYPDKEDRKRIEKKEILPRKELNYQTEANTPHEINDLLNDINKLRYVQNQSLPDIRTRRTAENQTNIYGY